MKLWIVKECQSGWKNSVGERFEKVVAVCNTLQKANELLEECFDETMSHANIDVNDEQNKVDKDYEEWSATVYDRYGGWCMYEVEEILVNEYI